MVMTRCWDRSIRLFFTVLVKNDKLVGKVRRYFARKEFQSAGSLGNKAHIHCGITLEPGTFNEVTAMGRISNRVSDAFDSNHFTDYESLLSAGLVTDERSFLNMHDIYEKLQHHTCPPRCKMTDLSGKTRCRNKKHPVSFVPSFQSFPGNLHPSYPILKTLGLTVDDIDGDRVIEKLAPGIYHPPSERNNQSMVATIPLLQCVLGSQTNVQLCDIRGGASYTAKYCAKREEHRQVVFTPKNGNTVVTEPRDLYNEGITSARLAQQERLKNAKAPEPFCREISLSEIASFVSGHEYVLTNVVFIKVHTTELESRVSVVRSSQSLASNKIVDHSGRLTPALSRSHLPESRRFSANQMVMMKDFASSQYLVDSTSSFSLRPPELMLVNSLELYMKIFSRCNLKTATVVESLSESHLVDGGHSQVRVRRRYLQELIDFYSTVHTEAVLPIKSLLSDLADELLRADEPSAKLKRYVDLDATQEVIIVFSNITPSQIHKFVYHLVLSMGRFDTELDFLGLSLVECCQKSKLFPNADSVTSDDVDLLCRRYIEEQLVYLPISSRQVNAIIPLLYYGLRKIILTTDPNLGITPLLTHRSIQESALDKLLVYENTTLLNLILALEHEIPEVSDFKTSLVERQIVEVDISITGTEQQPHESVLEQTEALKYCIAAIDGCCSPLTTFQRSVILCGLPGAGKTYIFNKAVFYALCKGKRVIITAITSERATKLGGVHLHFLFMLPVSTTNFETSASLALKTISALSKNKVRMAYLRRLDIIFFDEFGLLSISTLATLDVVLRAVRENDSPFGGVLFICTGDQEQLKPIEGSSIFRSTHLVTLFSVVLLKHNVRARCDSDLRELVRLLRLHPLSQEQKDNVVSIIKRRCARNFVNSWKDVPEGVLRIVGKKAAVKKAIDNYIELKMADPRFAVHTEEAVDQVEKNSGNWVDANSEIKSKLNYNTLEVKTLHIFLGTVMKFTFNNTRATAKLPRFSQGQLCVVEKLPDPNDAVKVIVVRVMPPGVRQQMSNVPVPDSWPKAYLVKRGSNPIVVGCGLVKAKRIQFPLRHHVCTTIHKAIGESCPAIATQMSSMNAVYKLWDLHQFLVLISRVHSLSDIYFVGGLSDTIEAIRELLDIEDPSTSLQAEVVEKLNCLRGTPAIVPPIQPLSLTMIECDVPSVNMGFVYLLASSKDLNVCKMGHCSNIRKEMENVNTPAVTADFQHSPYMLMAFVSGFFGEYESEENLHQRTSYFDQAVQYFYEERSFRSNYENFKWSFQGISETTDAFSHLLLKECYILPDIAAR